MRVLDQVSHLWVVVYLSMLVTAAVGATLFPLLYAFMMRWWENPMGRYMMYKGIVLAVTLDLSVARIFIPTLPVWVSFAVLAGVAIMVWWILILFVRTWRKGRKKRQAMEQALARRRERAREDLGER